MNKQLTKIIAASVLADGYIEKQKYGNARYKLSQKSDHLDYIDYISNYLETLTKVTRYEIPAASYEIKNKLCNVSAQLRITTMAHPAYTTIHSRFYLDGVKRVSQHDLVFIDAEFMAVWFQEDGSTKVPKDSKSPNLEISLCTDSFSYGDQVLLRRAIIERTGFIFNVQRRGKNKNGEQTYRLHLSRKQTDEFIDYVYPYIVPSFMYKIERQEILTNLRNSPTYLETDSSYAEMT